MVVKLERVDPAQLDLGYAALFVGLRVNELVMERLKRGGFENVRESHGYVIQHLIGGERSITELARRMEVTQQAASKAVAQLVELGILEAAAGADRRSKRIRLSARGWESVRRGREIRRRIEGRLRGSIGERRYSRAKETLLACLGELGGLTRIRSRRVRMPG